MSHEKVNTDSRLKSADEELLAEGGSEGGERSAIDTPPDSTSATVSPVHQAKSTKSRLKSVSREIMMFFNVIVDWLITLLLRIAIETSCLKSHTDLTNI